MKWKQKEIEFLKENYRKLGRSECAKILNRTVDSVTTKIRDEKLNLKSKNSWCEEELNFLINNYENFGVDYCANKLKTNRRRVISKANNLGLKTKIIIKSESKNKKIVNHTLFKNEFTKESVYILGLLWADGHVKNKNMSISCVESDINEVIPIFLKTGDWLISNPIKKYFNGNEVKTQKRISTTTWALYNILEEYGFLTKSNGCPLEMINKIPDSLKKYWYRGFLDGDGCIRLGKKYGSSIVFAGPYKQNWFFLEKLCEHLNINFIIERKIIKLGGQSHFIVHRKKDVKILGDYLYCDYDNIGFSRKYNKYIEVNQRFINNNNKFWSNEDIIWLKENYKLLGGLTCAKKLNKTLVSIYNKINCINHAKTR